MSQASRSVDDVSFVSPAGVKMSGPPGLLQFLVGIQANESGWDYFRAQGSPGGSIEPPSDSVGGGYGAYQFQVGTGQWEAANAKHWSPAAQDEIAASMAKGYYSEFGPLSKKTGVNIWEYVAEAWYGPGTVPQNPMAPSSVPDVANVLAAESGHANLPSAFVYGPGYKGGLSVPEVKKELGGGVVQANPGSGSSAGSLGSSGSSASTGSGSLTDTYPGGSLDPLNWPGEAAGSLESSLGRLLLEGGIVLLGVALVVVGGYVAAGKKPPSITSAAGLAALA